MSTDDGVAPRLAPFLDLIGAAIKVKLAHELGRHRLARRVLDDLTEQTARLRVQVYTAAAAQLDDDPDLDLGQLLDERHPPAVDVDDDAGCDK